MDQDSIELQKKFDLLPEAIKEAITSVDFATKLQAIGKNHGLHLDELDSLIEEVGYVMIGETKPQDFKKKLAARLSLAEEKVVPLVQTLDTEIFRPIKIALIEISSKPPVSPPPPPTFGEGHFGEGQTFVLAQAVAAAVKPPEAVRPHKEDYDMSRDAILSAIENPPAAEVQTVYSPHRTPESTDPKEYLLQRKGLAALLEKSGAAPKKHSLSEEAVLVAKKKAAAVSSTAAPASKPYAPPPQVRPAAAAPAPAPALPPKPSDKLSAVVQVPSTKIEIKKPLLSTETAAPSGAKVDPYREPIG